MVVEAEVGEGRDGLHLELLDGAVRLERERHVSIFNMGRAPPGDERVVLPVLEVAYESRGVTEPHPKAPVIEADRGVAVRLFAVRPGVSPERDRRPAAA